MASFSGRSQEVLGRSTSDSSQIFGNAKNNFGRHQSLAEVLRTTTMEEFFEAIEKVTAEDERSEVARRKFGKILGHIASLLRIGTNIG